MKPDKQLSSQALAIKPGLYEHYKGKQYEVLGIAFNSETLEELVIYRAQYGNKSLWARPLSVFLGEVELSDQRVPRFKYIGK